MDGWAFLTFASLNRQNGNAQRQPSRTVRRRWPVWRKTGGCVNQNCLRFALAVACETGKEGAMAGWLGEVHCAAHSAATSVCLLRFESGAQHRLLGANATLYFAAHRLPQQGPRFKTVQRSLGAPLNTVRFHWPVKPSLSPSCKMIRFFLLRLALVDNQLPFLFDWSLSKHIAAACCIWLATPTGISGFLHNLDQPSNALRHG